VPLNERSIRNKVEGASRGLSPRCGIGEKFCHASRCKSGAGDRRECPLAERWDRPRGKPQPLSRRQLRPLRRGLTRYQVTWFSQLVARESNGRGRCRNLAARPAGPDGGPLRAQESPHRAAARLAGLVGVPGFVMFNFGWIAGDFAQNGDNQASPRSSERTLSRARTGDLLGAIRVNLVRSSTLVCSRDGLGHLFGEVRSVW
jgi:hypothetical protein